MAVIGVIGRKGGVGKTTVAVHLAAELSTGKTTVAVVDCDAQASATYWADPGQLPVPVLHHPLEHAREIQTWSRDVRDIDADLLVLDGPPHLNEATLGRLEFFTVHLGSTVTAGMSCSTAAPTSC